TCPRHPADGFSGFFAAVSPGFVSLLFPSTGLFTSAADARGRTGVSAFSTWATVSDDGFLSTFSTRAATAGAVFSVWGSTAEGDFGVRDSSTGLARDGTLSSSFTNGEGA